MEYNWMPIIGNFEQDQEKIVFKGGYEIDTSTDKKFPSVGNYISDKKFGGGEIEATVCFPKLAKDVNSCGLLFGYDSNQRYFITTSIDVRKDIRSCFSLKHFDTKWVIHDSAGEKAAIKPGKDYKIKVILDGSTVEFLVNNVSVIKKVLPFTLPTKQVGIWCQGSEDIIIKDFKVHELEPKVFIIMQFSAPYNELFQDVIKPVCEEKKIKVIRADEQYGPGHILTDIMKEIYSAKFIIAEITPSNQNVFFEVGYAHAMRKPIVFIAEKGKDLPFDVSSFRVLFYENTIRGKNEIMDGLRRNIEAILTEPFA